MVLGPAQEAPVRSLVAELGKTFKKPLSEVFKDPRKRDTESYPYLARQVERLQPAEWKIDPTGAYIVTIRRAVLGLSDNEKPESSNITWRRFGIILCGFENDIPVNARGTSHTYSDYCRFARSESGIRSDRTFGRVAQELRRRLAEILFSLEPDLRRSFTLSNPSPAHEDRHEIMGGKAAMALVASWLPGYEWDDHWLLATSLWGHRQSTEQACIFLHSNPDISPKQFCDAIARDPSLALEAVAGHPDTTLAAVYRYMMDHLSKNDPLSLRALEVLTFVASTNVPSEYVMSYLLGQPFISKDQLFFASSVYTKAMKPLAESKLIVMDAFTASINPLAQAILRDLMEDRFADIYQRLRPMLSIGSSQLWANGWGTYTSAGRWLCNTVADIRWRDHTVDGDRLRRQGKLNGPSWEILVWELEDRTRLRQTLSAAFTALTSRLERGEHLSAIERFERLSPLDAVAETNHEMQLAERQRMSAEWEEQHKRIRARIEVRRSQRKSQTRNTEDGFLALAKSLSSLVTTLAERHVDTGIGNFDLKDLIPEWPEFSEDALAQTLHKHFASVSGTNKQIAD